MLAKWMNNDKSVTRLMVTTMLIACVAVAGMVAYTGFSSDEESISVYAAPADNGSLQLRGALLALGDGAQVNEVVFTVAIAEGADPINFTAPPGNVVMISYVDDEQHIDDISWYATEYGQGDGDNMLEAGENFRINAAIPDPGAGAAFAIEVRTPDGKILEMGRILPDELKPVMNLR